MNEYEHFDSKIQKLEERIIELEKMKDNSELERRISFLEELTKQMAFERKLTEKLKELRIWNLENQEELRDMEPGKPNQILMTDEDGKPKWVDDERTWQEKLKGNSDG